MNTEYKIKKQEKLHYERRSLETAPNGGIIMKLCITLIFALFVSTNGYSQYYSHTYFGYPPSSSEIEIGTRIIINSLDRNAGSAAIGSKKLEFLIKFLNENEKYRFSIEIHRNRGSQESSKKESEVLCKWLKERLDERCKHFNYDLEGKGNENPLFCGGDESYNKILNDRLELIVISISDC
jgi:hypothetical protein